MIPRTRAGLAAVIALIVGFAIAAPLIGAMLAAKPAPEFPRVGAMEDVDALYFRTRVAGGWIYATKETPRRLVFVPDPAR